MNLVLIFPPLADATQPYSSLPALTGYLRERGWNSVKQMDANIQFVRQMLNSRHLGNVLEVIEKRLNEVNRQNHLEPEMAAEYGLLARASLKAPFVLDNIDSAIEALRKTDTFSALDPLNRNKRTIYDAMEILSAGAHPLRLGFSNATGPAFSTTAELAKWVMEEERNPFRRFFETHTLPELNKASPHLVGISVTYRSQVLASATLASVIKEHCPHVPVVFGGNMISLWYDGLESCPGLFRWCDYLIAFEGETALAALMATLSTHGSLDTVPNLVYRKGTTIRKNPVKKEDINCLPTPDYEGLPLDFYLAPEPVFLLYTSRGCYWSKCRFCCVSAAMRTGYRQRDIELIHHDIVNLVFKHRAKYIAFADDCVAPSTLEALVSRLKSQGPDIYYQCELRFEKALTSNLLKEMKETGCLNLIFGLESHSSHILALMSKGIRQDQIERILQDCRRHEIAFNLQFFFGFPGEQQEDAEETAQFIRKQMHGAATFSFGVFELHKGSMVDREPEAFGIEHVERDRQPLAVKYHYGPVASHANSMRSGLREELLERTPYYHAGLSINAHTLIFIHRAGFSAMKGLYGDNNRSLPAALDDSNDLMTRRLVSGRRQTVGTFAHAPEKWFEKDSRNTGRNGDYILLYDYDLDQTFELSPLAVWIMKNLDGRKTPNDLVKQLGEEMSDESPEKFDLALCYSIVNDCIKELHRRGFLLRITDKQD